jgi:mannose-1-phosphate guanylyltransferase
MRAMLLAAGLGTRLRPLTNHLPKCLVPIRGRPLLDYWLETLVNGGVSEILVNTSYLAPMVVEFLEKSVWTNHVTIAHEERLLGTAGTVLMNRSFFQNEPFLMAHADNLTIFNVQDFLKCHRSRPVGAEMTMMVFKTDNPQSCGIVEIDVSGMVKAFHEKVSSPPGNLANAAVYIVEASVIDFMATCGKDELDFSTEVIPHFMGRIFTHPNYSYHRDIGTITSWAEANKDFPVAADAHNSHDWDAIYESADGKLLNIMAKLLTDASGRASSC